MGFNSAFKGLTLNHDARNHEFKIYVVYYHFYFLFFLRLYVRASQVYL